MPSSRRSTAVIVASLALLLGAVPAAAAPEPVAVPGGATKPGEPSATTRTVTLITGDRVEVTRLPSGQRVVTPKAGDGREHVTFAKWGVGDQISVVPSDAMPLLVADRLDERLFDVTGLLRQGYGDASSPSLPVIVSHRPNPVGATTVRRAVSAAGVDPGHRLPSIEAVAVAEQRDEAGQLWAELTARSRPQRTLTAGVRKIWLDARVRATLDESVAQIGAPAAWDAGHTGDGVSVAVLDTGIDAEHPDLSDAVAQSRDFTDSPSGVRDVDGHGTHVASTITGSGAASEGAYEGVAPDAGLLVGKVLGDDGRGTLSQVISGMEWAAGQGADVVNLSLGTDVPSDGTDPLSVAVNELTEQTGSLFVVAAGNVPSVLGSPAAADAALTVGAVDKQDRLAGFSARGPRIVDHAIKPDVTAPGVGIVAARADGVPADNPVGDHYMAANGTSMAAPHASGAAAVLAGQHPEWTADQLKGALIGTAEAGAGYTVFEQGAGRIDLEAAVSRDTHVMPGNLSLYVEHGTDEPLTRTVSYHNSGDEAVSLELHPDVVGPAGDPAPPGLINLDQSAVTVPAGSTADVELTVSPGTAPAGSYTGRLVASSGSDVQASSLIGIYVEPPSHDVRIEAINRDGGPVPTFDARLIDLATGRLAELRLDEGALVGRIPAGTYTLNALALTSGELGSVTMFQRPTVVVDRDRRITLDARDGKRVRADVDADQVTRTGLHSIASVQRIGQAQVTMEASTSDGESVLYAVPTRSAADRPYIFRLLTTLVESPELDRRRAYNLALIEPGKIPEQLAIRVRDRDLARVNTRYHAQGVPGSAVRASIPAIDDFPHHGTGITHDVSLPETVIELFSTEDVAWTGVLDLGEFAAMPVTMSAHGPTERYAAGARRSRAWNAPVFAPAAKATHFGSGISLQIDPVSPGHLGHLQYPSFRLPGVTGSLTLRRDGEVVAQTDNPMSAWASVPPEQADYELEISASRDVPWSHYAVRTRGRWGFSSAVPDGAFAPVQLLTPRVSGDFDGLGRATANRRVSLDIDFEYLGAPTSPRVRQARAWASFDDGASWRRMPVHRVRGSWRAVVVHPASRADTGYASLRIQAEDAAGNAVEVETIRAYGLPEAAG